jgi:hypothetical protein
LSPFAADFSTLLQGYRLCAASAGHSLVRDAVQFFQAFTLYHLSDYRTGGDGGPAAKGLGFGFAYDTIFYSQIEFGVDALRRLPDISHRSGFLITPTFRGFLKWSITLSL